MTNEESEEVIEPKEARDAETERRQKANALIASQIDVAKLRALCEKNAKNSALDDLD